MVVGEDLVRRRGADGLDQFGVPGGAEGDDLREDGGLAEPREPVEGLGAGLERADPEPFDGAVVLVEQSDLLVEGEPCEQVGDALGAREAGVAERELVCVLGHVGTS